MKATGPSNPRATALHVLSIAYPLTRLAFGVWSQMVPIAIAVLSLIGIVRQGVAPRLWTPVALVLMYFVMYLFAVVSGLPWQIQRYCGIATIAFLAFVAPPPSRLNVTVYRNLYLLATITYVVTSLAAPSVSANGGEYVAYTVRQIDFFVHANERGNFYVAMFGLGATLSRFYISKQRIVLLLASLAFLALSISSESITSAVLFIGFLPLLFRLPIVTATTNFVSGGAILMLTYTSMFAPQIIFNLTNQSGSFYWRSVVAKLTVEQSYAGLAPGNPALLTLSGSWPHSTVVDLYTFFGYWGGFAFAAFLIADLLRNAQSLRVTVLAGALLVAMAQPVGALAAPFFVLAIAYHLATFLSDVPAVRRPFNSLGEIAPGRQSPARGIA